MKKILRLALLVVISVLLYTTTVFAQETIGLYMDGDKVATQSYTYMGEAGDAEGKYYMDVLPQVKNERTYISISVIAKFLGADISWENPTTTINYNNTELILTVGESEAIENGKRIKLDAAPYLDQGRLMVLLRFVSETFGLTIDYKDGRVDVSFPELEIHGTSIASVQSEYWMTMGSQVVENKNNLFSNRVYHVIVTSKGKEVAEPTLYGTQYMIDEPKSYTILKSYSFMNKDNAVVEQYEVYSELSFGMGTGVYIIRDVINSKWYSFSKEAYCDIIDLGHIGSWESISNTIV